MSVSIKCLNIYCFVRNDNSPGPKITSRQKQHMINFMKEHPILGFGPLPDSEDYSDTFKNQLWTQLESELNVIPGVRYNAAGYIKVHFTAYPLILLLNILKTFF